MRADLPSDLCSLGRRIYGLTPPSGALACERSTSLSDTEVEEVVSIVLRGRTERHAEELPMRLWTRDWDSIERVVLELQSRLSGEPAGWKVGGASIEVRSAEGVPSPSAGRIYRHCVFPSGTELPDELFINYRNCECEFAFELGLDFLARDEPYTVADVRAGVEALLPALEIGDTVFLDWYGASAYFGASLDNGGGAALVAGTKIRDWADIDLADAGIDVYLNDTFIKSGKGAAAMGNPLTSLTWMVNWARRHNLGIGGGELVTTGTCTGHLFTAPGDAVKADFGTLGVVTAKFA